MTQPTKSKYTLLRERIQKEINTPGTVTKSRLKQVLVDFPAETTPAPTPQPEAWRDTDAWPKGMRQPSLPFEND